MRGYLTDNVYFLDSMLEEPLKKDGIENMTSGVWILISITFFSILLIGLIILLYEIFRRVNNKKIAKRIDNKNNNDNQSISSEFSNLFDKDEIKKPLLDTASNSSINVSLFNVNKVRPASPMELMIKKYHIDAKCMIDYDVSKSILNFNVYKLRNISSQKFSKVYVHVSKLEKLANHNFLSNDKADNGIEEVITAYNNADDIENYKETYSYKGPIIALHEHVEKIYNHTFFIPLTIDDINKKFRICCKIIASNDNDQFKVCGELNYYENDIYMNYIHKNSKERTCVCL